MMGKKMKVRIQLEEVPAGAEYESEAVVAREVAWLADQLIGANLGRLKDPKDSFWELNEYIGAALIEAREILAARDAKKAAG